MFRFLPLWRGLARAPVAQSHSAPRVGVVAGALLAATPQAFALGAGRWLPPSPDDLRRALVDWDQAPATWAVALLAAGVTAALLLSLARRRSRRRDATTALEPPARERRAGAPQARRDTAPNTTARAPLPWRSLAAAPSLETPLPPTLDVGAIAEALDARHRAPMDTGECEVVIVAARLTGLDDIGARHGDEAKLRVLRAAASRLRQAVREVDELHRLAEDHFVLSLRCPAGRGEALAASVAERVGAALRRPVAHRTLTLRAGGRAVARCWRQGHSAAGLVEQLTAPPPDPGSLVPDDVLRRLRRA